jgi:hypothetical protein
LSGSQTKHFFLNAADLQLNSAYIGTGPGHYWTRSMDELAAVIFGLCSAGIFLAHAIDAYQAESEGPKDPQPEA